MPPKTLVNLEEIDLNTVEVDIEGIRQSNPQRYEMEQLTGIIRFAPEQGYVVGYKDITENEFWVRGHIPERPLMPGVIMCEAAAQLCTYYYKNSLPESRDRFVGFGGMQDVKFRGTVQVGDKLILIARSIELKPRRATFQAQGLVDGKIVFEAKIIGMPV
ncbi:MAG: 3-hydroxyacyl-ACP dehydratase FabZ family protein [Planctomycetota bacterium]